MNICLMCEERPCPPYDTDMCVECRKETRRQGWFIEHPRHGARHKTRNVRRKKARRYRTFLRAQYDRALKEGALPALRTPPSVYRVTAEAHARQLRALGLSTRVPSVWQSR